VKIFWLGISAGTRIHNLVSAVKIEINNCVGLRAMVAVLALGRATQSFSDIGINTVQVRIR
jgi:hypothetical protein